MSLRRPTIGLLLICSLLLPELAQAQDSSRPDPDSPAGVEYQLPLDQARRNAAAGADGADGRPRSSGGSASPAPLFGAGITRARSQTGTGPGEEAASANGRERSGDQSGDGRDTHGGGAGGGGTAGPGGGGVAPSLGTTAAEDGGRSTELILGGIALAVVAIGGALGLALRRGLGASTAS